MTTEHNQRPGHENISRGLAQNDADRSERAERAARRSPAPRVTYGADAATLSEWLDEDPGLINEMSLTQRIGLGLYENARDRDNDNHEGNNA